MNHPQIHAWALSVIDRARSGAQDEDDLVELKWEWKEPRSVAAQLAGLANASRGEPVLWLVGVNQAGDLNPALERIEISNWWAQVGAEFVSPQPTMLGPVPVDAGPEGPQPVAMAFLTDDLPYLVRRHDGGEPSQWVPWREGTATRAARQGDLLRMLVPQTNRPKLQVLDGTFETRKLNPEAHGQATRVDLAAHLYVELPMRAEPVVIPTHQLSGRLRIAESNTRTIRGDLEGISLKPPMRRAGTGRQMFQPLPRVDTILVSDGQTVLGGPGTVHLTAFVHIPDWTCDELPAEAHVRVSMQPLHGVPELTLWLKYCSPALDGKTPIYRTCTILPPNERAPDLFADA